MSGLELIISNALAAFNAFNTVAEVEATPYVVFQVRESPRKTRDGIYKYECNVTVVVVGKDFDECDTLNDHVVAAINEIVDINIISFDSQRTTDENNAYMQYNEFVISIKK